MMKNNLKILVGSVALAMFVLLAGGNTPAKGGV
jgi:hypothetical protein